MPPPAQFHPPFPTFSTPPDAEVTVSGSGKGGPPHLAFSIQAFSGARGRKVFIPPHTSLFRPLLKQTPLPFPLYPI